MKPQYLHLRPDGPLPDLAPAPYRIVLIADHSVSAAWLNVTAEWIVGIGSLYVIAWGIDCEKWHDSVDWAVLEAFSFGEIPDDRFVMTTWHSGEPMSEALWFAENCAHHPDVELSHTILLHIAETAQSDRILQAWQDSQVMRE
ncbi:DUF7684 family protein [Sphingomonas sp. CJ99]